MRYIYHFDIAAIILTTTLLLLSSTRKAFKTTQSKWFDHLLWINLFSSTFDFISTFTISFPHSFPLWFNYAINIFYMLCNNNIPIIYIFYIASNILNKEHYKKLSKILTCVLIFNILLTSTTSFTHFVFYFDSNLEYCHGLGMTYMYAQALLWVALSGFIYLINRKKLTSFQFWMYFSYIPLLISSVIIQIIYKNLLIESFTTAIALLLLYSTISGTAEYMYKNTYCFNQSAFNHACKEKIENQERFTILAFYFKNLNFYKRLFGQRGNEELIDTTINICQENIKGSSIFLLDCGAFALFVKDSSTKRIIRTIDKLFEKQISLNSTKLTITPYYAIFRHPGFVKNSDDVTHAIESMLSVEHNANPKKITEIFDVQLADKTRELKIVKLLTDAIENDGFEMYYQPIYHRKTGKFTSAEALIRLKNSDMGYISPEEFIPIAERNGLILDIGNIVIEKVCKCFVEKNLASYGIQYMELNLSLMQLLENSTPESIQKIMEKYNLSAKKLNLEITESASSDDKSGILANINKLTEMGFDFSLDDYGSGYASLSYLIDMPFTIVKIDKYVIWNAMKDEKSMSILRNTINLINDLGKECVAEGVETKEMEETLSALGVDLFQGYLYSKPIPTNDYLKFLMKFLMTTSKWGGVRQ